MTLTDATAEPAEKPMRFRLREATAPLHERVDAHMDGLLRQKESGYGQFLVANAQVILPLERALSEAGVARILPDWPTRSRAAALRADLAALSIAEPDAQVDIDESDLRSEAYMLGVMYVLEGSRLGARVLLRMLENAPQNARAYLSHGQEPPLWQSFVAQLEASSDVRRNPEKTEAGAAAAFALFLPNTVPAAK